METSPLHSAPPHRNTRHLVGYWLLGLCNNFGYVVMLSAAHDVLSHHGHSEVPAHSANTTVSNSTRECNPMSTGAILLADILPALFIKVIAPFLPFRVHVNVLLVVILSAIGFGLVAVTKSTWLIILGVASTSFASGLGEMTFLSHSHKFHRDTICMWSSGTGGAGIFGAGSYAGFTALGLSPSASLWMMQVVPALMALSFWVILRHPSHSTLNPGLAYDTDDQTVQGNGTDDADNVECIAPTSPLSELLSRIYDIRPLLKFMIPFGLVYVFEYFINQGLFELLYYPGIWLDHKGQYRWLQFDYQVGVFLSRSSGYFIKFRMIWLMAVLQFLNVILFTFEAIYQFVPSFWIVFVLVLWEGTLGGASYVNTFYLVAEEVPAEKREFSMGITTVADAIGICLAGVLAIPAHNAICSLPPAEV